MPSYNLAIVGFGNVGRAFLRMLVAKETELRRKYDIRWRLTGVATRRVGWFADADGLNPIALLNGHWPTQSTNVAQPKNMREWLERGCGGNDSKAAAFCANVLAVEPALWTFTRKAGVEPTNNHIERLLRPGVLWRKNAFGCHSEAGCRFVERILTAVQTRRLQKRPVLPFLYESLLAYRYAQKAPLLLGGA